MGKDSNRVTRRRRVVRPAVRREVASREVQQNRRSLRVVERPEVVDDPAEILKPEEPGNDTAEQDAIDAEERERERQDERLDAFEPTSTDELDENAEIETIRPQEERAIKESSKILTKISSFVTQDKFRVELHVLNPISRKWGFVQTISVMDESFMDFVSKEYGPGEYQLRTISDTGRPIKSASGTFIISDLSRTGPHNRSMTTTGQGSGGTLIDQVRAMAEIKKILDGGQSNVMTEMQTAMSGIFKMTAEMASSNLALARQIQDQQQGAGVMDIIQQGIETLGMILTARSGKALPAGTVPKKPVAAVQPGVQGKITELVQKVKQQDQEKTIMLVDQINLTIEKKEYKNDPSRADFFVEQLKKYFPAFVPQLKKFDNNQVIEFLANSFGLKVIDDEDKIFVGDIFDKLRTE